jgi:NADH-quinone oxidoreductase subunit M
MLAPSAAAVLVAVLPITAKAGRWILAAVAGLLALASFGALLELWGPWSALSEDVLWVPQLGAHYALAIDGLSGTLLTVLFLLMAMSMAAAELSKQTQAKGPDVLIALMASGMAGVLLARDLVLFFLFWELMVLALFVLVNRYGGEEHQRAALQFLVYTVAGSLLMLVAIAGTYMVNAPVVAAPLSLQALPRALSAGPFGAWLALGFLVAFLIKLPVVPLHIWLPDLYRQMPTHLLVIAAFMAKLGGYGILRFFVYPQSAALQQMATPLAILALAGFLYASAIALGQRKFSEVLIYSSIAHMNLFLLGALSFNAAGHGGAALQLLNQGLLLGITFYLSTWLGPSAQDEAGVGRLPWGRLYLLLGVLASLGMPGLNGFAGELLILSGAIQRWPALAILALAGIAMGATYFILTYKRLAHGQLDRCPEELPWPHRAVLAVPLLLSLGLGLAPSLALQFLGQQGTSSVLLLAARGLVLATGGAQ